MRRTHNGQGFSALSERNPARPSQATRNRGRKREAMTGNRTRVLVEIALTVALAVVLGLLKLWEMPYGGSISLEMLPILVLALRRGWRVGVLAGALYGVVALMFGGLVVHPVQFVLDYPVAFALAGLAGVVTPYLRRSTASVRTTWPWIVGGVALGSALRFVSHWVSGLVFFGQYAAPGQPAWLYSLLYNGSYLVPAAVICAVAAVLLVPALERAVPVR
jgi:thiamine transporter